MYCTSSADIGGQNVDKSACTGNAKYADIAHSVDCIGHISGLWNFMCTLKYMALGYVTIILVEKK